MKNPNTINLTIMNIGIVLILNPLLAQKIKDCGWEVLDIFGYHIGISYPKWVYNLINKI